MDAIEPQPHAGSGFGGHLGSGTGDTAGAEILEPDHQVTLDELQGGLDQELLRERVTHLDGGTLLERRLVELGGGENARPSDTVPPGRRPEEDAGVAGSLGA